MEECNCQTPGDRNKDFIEGYAPVKGGGWKLAWYARKDCPLHGMKEIAVNDLPQTESAAE